MPDTYEGPATHRAGDRVLNRETEVLGREFMGV